MMDYAQALVSITIFSICILVGLPVWWKTTTVYRANLPLQRISTAQTTPVKLNINIEVVVSSKIPDAIEALKKTLHSEKQISSGLYILQLKFSYNKITFEGLNPKDHCLSLESLPEKRETLDYKFLIQLDTTKSNEFYYCDDSLNTIISVTQFNVADIIKLIDSVMVTYLNTKDFTSRFQSEEVLKPAQNDLSMPPAVGYSIVLTLAVANPADYMPSWNIQGVIDRILSPLLSKLSFLGEIRISSQIIYYIDFKEKPIQDGDSFYYTKDRLPLLMNEVQPRLSTYTSTNTTLNFILYIPPTKYVPLYIRSNKKTNSMQNAFHSTRWGGLQFYNPQNITNADKKFEIPMDTVMKKFVYQFGELFGLSHTKYGNLFPQNDIREISEWSRTSLMITKTFEYMKKSLDTLVSLCKLLKGIENIVISEEIKFLIESSLNHYEQAGVGLSNGRINDAVRHSKKSFEYSEKAFYDASLLALLYFPDDQKYAIYVPLFLPIAFPIIGSVYRSFMWVRKKEKTL